MCDKMTILTDKNKSLKHHTSSKMLKETQS